MATCSAAEQALHSGDGGEPARPNMRFCGFYRRSPVENAIFIVPALGGAERKLGQTEPSLSRQAWPQCRLSWSPDVMLIR
ncbi:MAG TPA: hypothetical protein VFF31_18180 [Blastocatellia bacterium]|nr:hypothetical protein [Blastocatellia bacterium]